MKSANVRAVVIDTGEGHMHLIRRMGRQVVQLGANIARPHRRTETLYAGGELRCSPPGSIDHDELMFNQQAFRYRGPSTTRPHQFPEGDKKMNDE